MNIFYLGPAGTFTHDAAVLYFGNLETLTFEPCRTPSDVMQHLTCHTNAFGVVPIENSIHGEVVPTLDALCFEFADIYVVGEVSIPISFNWYAIRADAKPNVVISHPHALAQCKRFLALQSLVEQTSSSTAEACLQISVNREEGLSAIASPTAGARFGLALLEAGIEDHTGAHTRFLILGDHFSISEASDRTMLALLPPSNKTGVLAHFSGVLAEAGVNILSIHTRPMRTGPGNYLFVMTLEGKNGVSGVKTAVADLLAAGYGAKLLGVYKAWTGALPVAPWPHLPGLLNSKAYEDKFAKASRIN